MNKKITHSYIAKIYDENQHDFIEFGISYATEKECLEAVAKHAQKCLDIYNRYKDISKIHALNYLKKYQLFQKYPVQIIETKYIIQTERSSKMISILDKNTNNKEV